VPVPEPVDPRFHPRLDLTVDPDVDLHDERQRAEIVRREWDILLAIAIGGVLGTEARYGLAALIPHGTTAWPWSTLVINVVGSAVLGVLMGVLGELDTPPRLARPFIGVGVCGGFTTFSAFSVDAVQMLHAGRVLYGLLYVVASVLACAAGVLLAGTPTRRLMQRRAR
jgi:fluoride exporter